MKAAPDLQLVQNGLTLAGACSATRHPRSATRHHSVRGNGKRLAAAGPAHWVADKDATHRLTCNVAAHSLVSAPSWWAARRGGCVLLANRNDFWRSDT
jgi:hypothetical protein